MSKNITTIEKSAIEYLCGLIRDLSKVSEGIDDLNLRSDGVFSSLKINTLLDVLKKDCNDYTDKLVSNLSRLELKIVTNEADINKSNILYLHKPDGATSYNQYVVIEGNKVLLGTTDISMTDYYTITQADAKFALKTTTDTLTTEVTNIKSDFTTHKNDADIHTSADEKASYVKKTDITTTIDGTSTDTQVPSAKSIFNAISKLLECKENTKDLDIDIYEEPFTAHVNSNSGVLGTFPNGVIWGTIIQLPAKNYRCQMFLAINKMYYRTMNNKVWGNWIEVCTTKVKDIPVTNISMSSTYTSNANCKYQVVNGVCYIDFMSGTYKLTSNVNGVILATGLPIPRTGQVCTTYVPWSCADASKQVILFINGRGELILHASVNANATPVFCTFSYPVKEI